MNPSLPSSEKRLDQMDRLADMAHFPALVNAGATANILGTLLVTWWLVPRVLRANIHYELHATGTRTSPFAITLVAPLVWTALVLLLNLAPVVLLRALDSGTRPMPRLREMNFVRDQHRFSDWVYLGASANMAFWILLSWPLFILHHTAPTLALLLLAAFLLTFSPVLLRPLTRRA